ncbi:chromatin modification-related protein EAF7-domain-containing protein [Thelonectria olida]|uniref:Chromatin modification-related protein EAF7-domain-containing protein n=1 Tax=Thelonectria olida TaxID=1576542 RepID=A0A9P8WE60_9HYPO|nr:chromatin modification-related protein EAF7-domain-containing protein [Thelonectria olida]
MAPRKRARGSQAAATPTVTRDDDMMDVDTPPAGDNADDAPEPKQPDNNYNELWTDDQVASLFKGVIRWKPAGMHRHFRMIAISEHLRNHGFDPDFYQHTRIPFIWQKLRTYYNLEVIDERENFDEDESEDRYNEFSLPKSLFFDAMMQRAIADPSEAPTSPAQLDLSPPPSPPKKRKRGETVSKTRGTSVEDTEEGTDAPSPATKGKKPAGTRKRAASRAKEKEKEKQEKAETTEEDEAEDEDDSNSSSDGEESVEDRGTPVSRTTRNAKRASAAAAASRTRARGRRARR